MFNIFIFIALLTLSMKSIGSSELPTIVKSNVSISEALVLADQAIAEKNYSGALSQLRSALQPRANKTPDPTIAAKGWYRMAWISRILGEQYPAIDQLKQAVSLTRSNPLQNKRFLQTLLHDLGVAYMLVADYDSAIGVLTEASQFEERNLDKIIRAKIAINLAHALIENDIKDGIEQRLTSIYGSLGQLGKNKQVAELLLSVGHLYHLAEKKFGFQSQWRLQAYKILSESSELAAHLQNSQILSYAFGFIGQLYEDEARFDEAMDYTRKAIFHAQAISDSESLFKWEWQVARILVATNKPTAALDAYRQTTKTFKKVRLNILLGAESNFQRYVAPIYYQYVDLLLSQATAQTNLGVRLALRQEAIKVLEKYKLAEVEDYFHSACVETDPSQTPVGAADPGTAVIYPVALKDRIELVVYANNIVAQYAIYVNQQTVKDVVRSFREKIQQPGSKLDYLQDAKTLYSWLVEPYLELVNQGNINNLLFVPDGPFRSIPMSALHDGNKFLIESFTTATTPALALTSLQKPKGVSRKVLLSGVTKAVQGYNALPSVNSELQNISTLFPSMIMKDEDFMLSRAERELTSGDHSIVHIATHGEFSSDYRNSYLLTFDNKLTMSKLEKTIGIRRFKDDPLDLMVLSACQTAVGDDKAALGLAGVAIKAGARSAIATLWFISDRATSKLISNFYKQLQQETTSKAVALKNAQLSLIKSEQHRHPYFWAPFLLIGNWL